MPCVCNLLLNVNDDSELGVPSLQLVGIRAGFQGAFVAAAMARLGIGIIPPEGTKLFVLLRGMIGGFGFLCYFHAMTVLDIGDAITLLSLYPVFSVFFGWCDPYWHGLWFAQDLLRAANISGISWENGCTLYTSWLPLCLSPVRLPSQNPT